jgi:hypothetical protein
MLCRYFPEVRVPLSTDRQAVIFDKTQICVLLYQYAAIFCGDHTISGRYRNPNPIAAFDNGYYGFVSAEVVVSEGLFLRPGPRRYAGAPSAAYYPFTPRLWALVLNFVLDTFFCFIRLWCRDKSGMTGF